MVEILSHYILVSYHYNPSNYSHLSLFFHLVSLFYIFEKEKARIGINGIHETTRILRYGDIISVGVTKSAIIECILLAPHLGVLHQTYLYFLDNGNYKIVILQRQLEDNP